MSFIDTRFPDDIAYGSSGGPGHRTSIIVKRSGAEQRIGRWSQAMHQYNAIEAIKNPTDIATILDFTHAMRGSLYSFRFKDFGDFTTGANHTEAPAYDDVVIGVGDGTTTEFQMLKKYTAGGSTVARNITKPVSGTLKAGIDGVEKTDTVDFNYSASTGVITFNSAPGSGLNVTAGCEFDVPVRFGEEVDQLLDVERGGYNMSTISSLPLIEVNDVDAIQVPEYCSPSGQVTVCLSANGILDPFQGSLYIVDTDTAGLKILLPPKASMPLGGPLVTIVNVSPTYDLIVRDSDVPTDIRTLGTSISAELYCVVKTDSARAWYIR